MADVVTQWGPDAPEPPAGAVPLELGQQASLSDFTLSFPEMTGDLARSRTSFDL
jgi:hypothetical protein